MHAPVLVTPPAEMPVSLAEAKAQLRVEGGDEDGLITSLIQAATQHLDGYTGILGRALVSQTWRQDFDRFGRRLYLPLLAASVASITVRGAGGTISTIASENYALQQDALGSLVRFRDAFAPPGDLYQTRAVAVTYVAGYGSAASVPAPLKHAILLLVGHWFANREAVNVGNIVNALPMSVDALIAPFRRVGV